LCSGYIIGVCLFQQLAVSSTHRRDKELGRWGLAWLGDEEEA